MFVDSLGRNHNQATKESKKERSEHMRKKATLQASGVFENAEGKVREREKCTEMLSQILLRLHDFVITLLYFRLYS